jgi:hypothetical protein
LLSSLRKVLQMVLFRFITPLNPICLNKAFTGIV